jgi:hypothetical protein
MSFLPDGTLARSRRSAPSKLSFVQVLSGDAIAGAAPPALRSLYGLVRALGLTARIDGLGELMA